MSPNWSDESALNKCTYFAVIDKLQRAKAVDPSVAEEANKLIGTYSGHTPQAKDLFMLGKQTVTSFSQHKFYLIVVSLSDPATDSDTVALFVT